MTDERLLSDTRLGTLAQDHHTAVLTGGQWVVAYDQTNLEGRVRITTPGDTPEADSFVDLPGLRGSDNLIVTALADGGFVLGTTSRGIGGDRSEGISLRAYDADGTPRGAAVQVVEGPVSNLTYGLTELPDGGFVLDYRANPTNREDRHDQLLFLDGDFAARGAPVVLSPDGILGQNTTAANTDVAVLADGTLAVAYGVSNSTFVRDVMVQRYRADGTPIDTARQVADVFNGGQLQTIRVEAMPGGGFGVFWMALAAEPGVPGGQFRVFVQRYNAAGRPEGEAAPLPASADAEVEPTVQFNTYASDSFDVAVLDNGQIFVATSTQDPDLGADEEDVGYAVYDATGALLQPFTLAPVDRDDDQRYPLLDRVDGDTLLLTYFDDQNVLLQQQSGIDGLVLEAFTPPPLDLTGTDGEDLLRGGMADDTIDGRGGSDTIEGGDGFDRLIGGLGDDLIFGGATIADLRDLIFGGAGNDTIDGGHGNDELRGDAGNDSIAGGFGADTVIGGAGNDTLTGSAFGDVIFGGDGMDFVNGGFGSDRVNGGADADLFFHLGIADHGNDWIQDYSAADGDVLVFGGTATADQFQINVAVTASAGDARTSEAFVIYRPTGQIIWALVDGMGEAAITLRAGGVEFDLMG
ncbi:calcium-binding protein [Jannaschia sp. 2305UL9-9]|uniref:calcium-binding protein n=1 Tax=Jannaschia sp. 2305UL9-9 TaxID=3121638 RepID=UPI003527AB03